MKFLAPCSLAIGPAVATNRLFLMICSSEVERSRVNMGVRGLNRLNVLSLKSVFQEHRRRILKGGLWADVSSSIHFLSVPPYTARSV
jgi:hypothetical protein